MSHLWRRTKDERKVQNRAVFWSTWNRKNLKVTEYYWEKNLWVESSFCWQTSESGLQQMEQKDKMESLWKTNKTLPNIEKQLFFFREHCCVLLILLYFSICCQKILSEKERVWNTCQWICQLLKAKLGVGLLNLRSPQVHHFHGS